MHRLNSREKKDKIVVGRGFGIKILKIWDKPEEWTTMILQKKVKLSKKWETMEKWSFFLHHWAWWNTEKNWVSQNRKSLKAIGEEGKQKKKHVWWWSISSWRLDGRTVEVEGCESQLQQYKCKAIYRTQEYFKFLVRISYEDNVKTESQPIGALQLFVHQKK